MPDTAILDLIRPCWGAPANVHAFTTTRKGGVSDGPWSSLNLGSNSGDEAQHVGHNRRLLRALLPSEPLWLNQVHGKRVAGWERAHAAGCEADASIADRGAQVCAVLTADCLPVLFCNRQGTKVAAAHAGWRGLAAGVLEATVAAMACEPKDLLAWLGPAIGPLAFEVGQDVHDAFVNLTADNSAAFKAYGERWLADLYQLATLALVRAGVEQVAGGGYCTYSEPETFFSYRRDGVTGRMASVIWLEQ